MRRYLLAAVAAAAISTPAAARDGSTYVGVEVGAMHVEDTHLDFDLDAVDDVDDLTFNDALTLDYNTGIDVDLIAGHDFGMLRGEVELGYKRASLEEVVLGEDIAEELPTTPGSSFVDADGRGSVLSAMANLLLDVGDDTGIGGYLGGGIGFARVKLRADFDTVDAQQFGFSGSDSALAWQVIAGFRAPISENIDLGLKYRYFNTRKLDFEDDDFFVDGSAELSGKWKSHSLLASLIYNFYAPPPPPPPPPPAPPPPPPPATQTCPDGTVVLATEPCPAPPPPPPPPPPAPERG